MKIINFKAYTKEEKITILQTVTILFKIQQFVESEEERTDIYQKMNEELTKLDVPLLNEEGGIRLREATLV